MPGRAPSPWQLLPGRQAAGRRDGAVNAIRGKGWGRWGRHAAVKRGERGGGGGGGEGERWRGAGEATGVAVQGGGRGWAVKNPGETGEKGVSPRAAPLRRHARRGAPRRKKVAKRRKAGRWGVGGEARRYRGARRSAMAAPGPGGAGGGPGGPGELHPRTGKLVSLSQGGRSAARAQPGQEFNHGLVLSRDPLRPGRVFTVRIDRKVGVDWGGGDWV